MSATPSAASAILQPVSASLRPSLKAGPPGLSVIIVNYRQWDKTDELVRLLASSSCVKQGRAEIIIVDNHSPAHAIVKRLRRLPHVSLRRRDRNYGFARAVNEGCRLGRGEWFLLLNPDITPTEGFLDGVMGLRDRLPSNAGIVGFHLRNSDGSRQNSAGSFPTLLSTLARLALPRRNRKYHSVRTARRCEVAWVTGCCLLVRGDCLAELHGLDEEYFLYYEDVDLCRRARQRGWSVWYEPELTVIHHHPLHQRAVPAALRIITRHSLLTYAQKHWGAWQFRILARIVQSEARLRHLAAWWHGDAQQMGIFAMLGDLCQDLRRGDRRTAQKRIDHAVHRIDVRVGV